MSTTLLLLLFILATLAHFSYANPLCTPSSCGVIRNISYPFRLNGDPSHCGHLILTCQHNLTYISLHFHNYSVKAIDYQNSSIRVADASLNNHNICSFPISSAYEQDEYFRDDSGNYYDTPYSIYLHRGMGRYTTRLHGPKDRLCYRFNVPHRFSNDSKWWWRAKNSPSTKIRRIGGLHGRNQKCKLAGAEI
ncbi:uncharacterized protein LOC125186256 [Salvia hispanica]|uniref:uncharacterized protein LOC125186256 n=1 Tax=Salvia hispanica TaxID=49212 RepID=UPI002009832B|nr:uncharacterized protein LOC125186256 [Salvia hispanica]